MAYRSLAKKAQKICVAYSGMERFFPADKIIMTGNPVRQNLLETIHGGNPDRFVKQYEKQILKNFSIKISDTDRICFSGPSGCGKTTLARLLIGLEKVESGKKVE